jgi:CPA2 family monovalent cation:H+ antiporter-2
MHDLPLITTIATAFTAAWVMGLITQKLGLSPIVGYLLAGVLIGPATPGVVADIGLAHQLAEVGVILLMFGVGLHFHVKDLMAVKGVAIPGAIGQSLMATFVGAAAFDLLGMPFNSGLVMGMAMAVASTVVLMRVLADANVLHSPEGHVAVGWLLVEDVLTVIVLVIIPIMGVPPEGSDVVAMNPWLALGAALLKLVVLVAIVAVGGKRIVPWVLVQVARLRSRELFTLTILVFSIAVAAGAYFAFGASMALGAFLAGMMVAQSPVSHQAAADALPLRDAFAVIFFVSVGMIFDPMFIVQQPLMILAALFVIFVVKPVAALAIVAALGWSVSTALAVAISLAQIGEFSFILSETAQKAGLLSKDGHSVLVASAILSITLNPLLFRQRHRIEAWLRGRPKLWSLLNARAERRMRRVNIGARKQLKEAGPVEKLAIVVGYGPVGRSVDDILRAAGRTTVIIDMNMDTISQLTRQGRIAIYGDASRDAVLEQANVENASHLILTLPQAGDSAAVVSAARNLNPTIRILVRARYLRERESLDQIGANGAVFEEGEAAVALARLVLAETGASRAVVEKSVRELRTRLILENVTNLSGQSVRNIMVPWTRVRRLHASASIDDVRRQVVEQHFSRWPVIRPDSGMPIGYLLVKDLISVESGMTDWAKLVRPLVVVQADDDIETILQRMQKDRGTVYLVEDRGSPVGLVTAEDVLEQVVGRIEDEYPHHPQVVLQDAIDSSQVILELQAETPEAAIAELAATIQSLKIPPGVDIANLALVREKELSTDVGLGVAIPHARCPHLLRPTLAFGRTQPEGILFDARSPEPVRLVFLLVTPLEQPELQVILLGKLAGLAGDVAIRERLLTAESPSEIVQIITSP